jgi:hypothetical protein
MHRRETRNYYSTANGRREKQREIFRKAKEEGRDPAEALREFMQSTQSGDEDSEGDESGDDDEKRRKRRRRSSVPSSVDGVDDPSTPGGSSKKTGEITRLTICVGKDCANLLDVQAITPPLIFHISQTDTFLRSANLIYDHVSSASRPQHPGRGLKKST